METLKLYYFFVKIHRSIKKEKFLFQFRKVIETEYKLDKLPLNLFI